MGELAQASFLRVGQIRRCVHRETSNRCGHLVLKCYAHELHAVLPVQSFFEEAPDPLDDAAFAGAWLAAHQEWAPGCQGCIDGVDLMPLLKGGEKLVFRTLIVISNKNYFLIK